MPSISATAVDEVATRRLEAMNRDLWARPWRWVFLRALELEGQQLHFYGKDHDKRDGIWCRKV